MPMILWDNHITPSGLVKCGSMVGYNHFTPSGLVDSRERGINTSPKG